MAIRAIRAPKSRHAILRFHFSDCRQKVAMDTFPKMMELCFPAVPYKLNKEDWFATFPNKSEIWFGGLDDKQRSEKVLGFEFSTMFLNECSQLSFGSRELAKTRLAQKAMTPDGPLPLRLYYDQNPPGKGHWTYKLFELKIDPESKQPLMDASMYTSIMMNPEDNKENISSEYIQILKSSGSRIQTRFLKGLYRDSSTGQLFKSEDIDKWRVLDGNLPDMRRIVVAVDPSGAADEESNGDPIGVGVAGLGTDGNAYILEDLTLTDGPAVWGKVAVDAYDRWVADRIVGETNYGGAMVKHVIDTVRPNLPFSKVTATRGKVVRAEPVSALCEIGKVRFVGYFPEMEDELDGFTVNGYTGERSPNRADWMIWAVTELFPGVVKQQREKKKESPIFLLGTGEESNSWMGH